MNRSGINPLAKKVLPLPKRLVSRLRSTHQPQDGGEEREYLLVGEHPVPNTQPFRSLSPPPQLETRGSPASDMDGTTITRRSAAMARELLLSLPFPCNFLDPEEVKLVGKHPTAAGGFANLWVGMYKGRKVGLKEYRCYASFDIDQVVARFCNEVNICNLLRHRDVDVVPLVGVYSTEAHPLVLVYEYADNLDLRQYLKNKPNVGKLSLLVAIAKCLRHMHGVNVVHGHLEPANVLIDNGGTPHIAGLGNASVLPHSTGLTAESRISAGRLSRNNAPEDVHDLSLPAKASDMYAFGVMAWEVLTGRPPFFEMTEIAATYSMLSGARPPRPNHHEITDRVSYMIERCWHIVPSKRMSVEEVVDLLEAEL